jgi:hypothetical protein
MVREGIQYAVSKNLEGIFSDPPEHRDGRIGQVMRQAERALLALECEENEG